MGLEQRRKPAGTETASGKPRELDQAQAAVVDELHHKGIAVRDFGNLFPDWDLSELRASAEKIIEQSHIVIEDLEESTARHTKPYLLTAWDNKQVDEAGGADFLLLALSQPILAIVSHYLGMYPRLSYLDLWLNTPTGNFAIASQQWHRDPDDKKLVKVFLYLRDVDFGSGPFHYISGTHEVGGRFGKMFRRRLPYGVYPNASEVDETFPEEDKRIVTGNAGTVIFCDTSGIHKGGYAIDTPRRVYSSPLSIQAMVRREGSRASATTT